MSKTAKHFTVSTYRDIDIIPDIDEGEFYEVYFKGDMYHYTTRHKAIDKVLDIYSVVFGMSKSLPICPPIIIDILKID